jgi:hypothetical protein
MNIQPLSPLFTIAGVTQRKQSKTAGCAETGNMIYQFDCFDANPSSREASF